MDAENRRVSWHSLGLDEVLERVEGSEEGLSSDAAGRRLGDFGANSLEAEEGTGATKLLVRQIHNPLIYLLFGAAVLSLIAGKTVDSLVIVGVVVLNTVLGFVQEWRAEGALAALRHMAAPHARVFRDGEVEEVEASEVVPGDLLVLETGGRVAADARVLSSEELRVDESALTGESEPVAKETKELEADTPMGDRRNMVWMSTSVTAGRGRAVVVETGMRTEMGQIAGDVRSTGREATPLQKRMQRLGLYLGILGIVLAGVVFGLGVLRGYETVEMLLFAVAVAVSAIPEGLPAVITVTLALGVRRMAERNAIIRRLPAVETLGSTTVICSDKTGTITKNEMTVRRIWAGGRTFEVTGEGYGPVGEIRADGEALREMPDEAARLLRIGSMANNAHVRQEDSGWRVEGNPSEGALLVAAMKGGMDPDEMRHEGERISEIPFSSDRKYMATLHAGEEGEGRIVLVKGAPDRLLEYSTHVLVDGKRVEMDEERRGEIARVNDELAGQALRVMAGCYRELGGDKEQLEEGDAEEGLTLAGLWGMIDPPREESARAVAEAKDAGIRPVLITGDYAATALAIARQVGIAEDGRALTAKDVEEMEQRELAEETMKHGVFARVSPAHKLRIMEALKAHGEVVAMTGDGVNDAPALKGADIGVAMGQSGTEVAKEAADMVLTDDNFATIVDAVEEGRTIYNNLRGVIFFLLCANAGELLTLAGALLLGLDLPLTATMILWVNLVTAGACTVPLGVEPRHEDVLKERPRSPGEAIVHWPMLRRIGVLSLFMGAGTLLLFWLRVDTAGLAYARTVAFSAMVAFEWFQGFNARSSRLSVFKIGLLSNRWLLLGVGTAVVLHVGVVQTGVGRWLFGTEPLGGWDWVLILAVCSWVLIADEVMKLLRMHRREGQDR